MGTPYTLQSYAPQTDDSERVLALKIARLFYDNTTGERGDVPQVDDDLKKSLYRIANILHQANAGNAFISF